VQEAQGIKLRAMLVTTQLLRLDDERLAFEVKEGGPRADRGVRHLPQNARAKENRRVLGQPHLRLLTKG
jgi:hypothetical protein